MLTTFIRMKVLMGVFQELLSPQERELTAKTEQNGGKEVALEDEHIMEELVNEEFLLLQKATSESRYVRNVPFDCAKLLQEIKANPDESIKKNAEFFSRKFNIQKKQIVEEFSRAFRQEGDRIPTSAEAGPHDRIVDPVWRDVFCLRFAHTLPFSPQEISKAWKDMVSGRNCVTVISQQRIIGMAGKRQGQAFHLRVERLLRREGCQRFWLRNDFGQLGAHVLQRRSCPWHPGGIR